MYMAWDNLQNRILRIWEGRQDKSTIKQENSRVSQDGLLDSMSFSSLRTEDNELKTQPSSSIKTNGRNLNSF